MCAMYNFEGRTKCRYCGKQTLPSSGDYKTLEKSKGLFSYPVYDLEEESTNSEYESVVTWYYKKSPQYCRRCGKFLGYYHYKAASWDEIMRYFEYCDNHLIRHSWPGESFCDIVYRGRKLDEREWDEVLRNNR